MKEGEREGGKEGGREGGRKGGRGGEREEVLPVMTEDDETELSHILWTNRGICLRKCVVANYNTL